MYTKTMTEKFMRNCSGESGADEKEKLIQALERADTVIIGAGAGLSTSAGFVYTGERFQRYFQDFADRYGFQDMYSGGFYPYETLEEYWGYWSRYIKCNRYMDPPKPVYERLLELVKKKDYFVLTTNVDHCFQKTGFDKNRLFYTQGDYGLLQCSKPCHMETYDNREVVEQMIKEQKGRKIPSELIPLCPKCGRPMTMNLRADASFVEDEGWHSASTRYSRFLNNHQKGKVLFLELGVGMNTPGIIKYPFWKMTYQWPDAVYACINVGEAFAPDEIKGKAILIQEDINKVMEAMSMHRQL